MGDFTLPRASSLGVPTYIGSAIGIRFDPIRAEVCGALVTSDQDPCRFTPEIAGFVKEKIPDDALRQLRQFEMEGASLDQRVELSVQFTEVASRLTRQLATQSGDRLSDILAVGVHGCAAWQTMADSRSYVGLCNAAALAEATGLTVVDEFPARDLAQGGLGGPVEAHGLWLLLADRLPVPGQRWRALADLGDTFHVSVIPPLNNLSRRETLVSRDVGPGLRLLTELLGRFAKEDAELDCGRLAVQGRVVPELLETWRNAALSQHAWQPHGMSVVPLIYALDELTDTVSLPDVLATATHFMAERIVVFIKHQLSHAHPIGEVVLAGIGRDNGMLLHELRRHLPAVQIRHIDELGFDDHVFAASIGALTLLHLWQVPLAPSPGANVPRILGRLTPGNPTSWLQVLRVMNSHARCALPLRDAI